MRLSVLAFLTALIGSPAWAEGERAGQFDYYLLSLSWQPGWCAREGDARRAPECEAGDGRGFTLHGLWPQYERGWPSHCPSPARDPSRSETAAMADVMGSAGLAWHQWRKHGRCSGLDPRAYFGAARRAYDALRMPDIFALIDRQIELPASVIEAAFVEANPGLTPDQITVTCVEGMIQEVRLCLTKDLHPRRCGADVIRDCSLQDAVLAPLR